MTSMPTDARISIPMQSSFTACLHHSFVLNNYINIKKKSNILSSNCTNFITVDEIKAYFDAGHRFQTLSLHQTFIFLLEVNIDTIK